MSNSHNINGKYRHVLRQRILDRDGDRCFYCGRPMPPGDRTMEHLETGKGNGIANMVLAHEKCNVQVGRMPIGAKLMYRDILHFTGRDHLPGHVRKLIQWPNPSLWRALETLKVNGS